MEFRPERVPRWIAVVGAAGTLTSGIAAGWAGAAGFALGTLGSWWNYASLQRVVRLLAEAAVAQAAPRAGMATAGVFLRLLAVGLGVLVILKYSKISAIPLLIGLFASCIAICLEILHEAVWSTKSG